MSMANAGNQTNLAGCTRLDYTHFKELMFLQQPVSCFSVAIQRYWKQIDRLNGGVVGQVDAYGLLHFFKFGHCDYDTADRLLAKGLLERVYVSDAEGHEREYPHMSSKGLNAIMFSLSDERVLYEVFPFIRDFGWIFVGQEEQYERCATFERATHYYDRSIGVSVPELLKL